MVQLPAALRRAVRLLALGAVVATSLPVPRAAAEDPPPAPAAPAASIQWFATWKQGAAEAARTGRPILLLAAAPQCHGISGMW